MCRSGVGSGAVGEDVRARVAQAHVQQCGTTHTVPVVRYHGCDYMGINDECADEVGPNPPWVWDGILLGAS